MNMSGVKIYRVGGAVRDEFLGLKPKDIDHAVEAPSYEAMRDYIASRGTIYLETQQYYTIRAKMPDTGDSDFVLCRREGKYTDGRRPDEVSVGTIHDDLARRDFTMNAIAVDISTQEVIDPHGGWEDIEKGLIRCVGDPRERFWEDSLRMIRALRFMITRPMMIEPHTDAILRSVDLADRLEFVSVDRIREELNKCLVHDSWRTMALLHGPYVNVARAFRKFFPGLRLEATTRMK